MVHMSHLSFEGQTKESYCIECAEKHGQRGNIFMREGLQRAEVCGNGNCEGVIEKVRATAEELGGIEADTENAQNEDVRRINSHAREIRKHMFAIRAELGQASIEQLQEIESMVGDLVNEIYEVRKKVDCPTCKIKLEEEQQEPEKPSLEQYGKTVAQRRKELLDEIRAGMGS